MSMPLKVLIIEDSENDALLIENELREGGYEPTLLRVETQEALEAGLANDNWDLIISDYRLPRFTGIDALKLIRNRDDDTPVIVVSGQISEETAVEAMRSGAQDYVLKDNLARLSPAVERELRERKIRQERREVEQQLLLSQEMFAKAFRSGPMVMAITQLETGRCIEVNETFEELIGYNCNQIEGKTVFDLRLWADVSERNQLVDALLRGEKVRNREVRLQTKAGSPLTGLLSAEVIEVDGENRLLTSVCDITDRKKAEEALENALDESKALQLALAEKGTELEDAWKRERHFSLLLQRALLPTHPAIGPGYNVAAEYVPMYSSHEIGGDFYDVFRVGDCRAGVLIGDVSGKGLEAAAMAATTRSTIHAFVHETASAAEALSRANSVLFSKHLELGSFVTVFLAVIDLCTGKATCANAGHPPQIISRCGHGVELTNIGGLPLAVVEKQEFRDQCFDFSPGDKMVLYTDGISEARHDSQLLDIEGVERIVAANGKLAAADLAGVLLKEATDWAEGKLQDDAAVVVVERVEGAEGVERGISRRVGTRIE